MPLPLKAILSAAAFTACVFTAPRARADPSLSVTAMIEAFIADHALGVGPLFAVEASPSPSWFIGGTLGYELAGSTSYGCLDASGPSAAIGDSCGADERLLRATLTGRWQPALRGRVRPWIGLEAGILGARTHEGIGPGSYTVSATGPLVGASLGLSIRVVQWLSIDAGLRGGVAWIPPYGDRDEPPSPFLSPENAARATPWGAFVVGPRVAF